MWMFFMAHKGMMTLACMSEIAWFDQAHIIFIPSSSPDASAITLKRPLLC